MDVTIGFYGIENLLNVVLRVHYIRDKDTIINTN